MTGNQAAVSNVMASHYPEKLSQKIAAIGSYLRRLSSEKDHIFWNTASSNRLRRILERDPGIAGDILLIDEELKVFPDTCTPRCLADIRPMQASGG